MANVRSIKRRIKSAKNIAQITKAMQMVAASKMRRAQGQALACRPYANELMEVVTDLRGKIDPNAHPLMKEPETQGKEALIVISPDKGLCGSLITNIGRSLLQRYSKELVFIAVGKKVKEMVIRTGFALEAFFEMGISQPKYEMVLPVAQIVIDGFTSGKYSKVSILYSHFVNTLSQRPMLKTLLPLTLEPPVGNNQEIQREKTEYLFEPTPDAVLNSLLPHYVEMELYQIILEAYASEQSARMVAMKNASDNAQDIMGELTLTCNKARQAQITNEIADIGTASLAVKKS